MSSRRPHNMANVGPSKFQPVSFLGFVTAAMSVTAGQPNFARSLAVSSAGTLCIHFWRLLLRNRTLPGAKFTASSKSCALLLAALLRGSRAVGASQTAALSTGHHLYLAGRPSGWALAHILVLSSFFLSFFLA